MSTAEAELSQEPEQAPRDVYFSNPNAPEEGIQLAEDLSPEQHEFQVGEYTKKFMAARKELAEIVDRTNDNRSPKAYSLSRQIDDIEDHLQALGVDPTTIEVAE